MKTAAERIRAIVECYPYISVSERSVDDEWVELCVTDGNLSAIKQLAIDDLAHFNGDVRTVVITLLLENVLYERRKARRPI